MRTIPDWVIQTSWYVAGIFGTGAVWYFLSLKIYSWAIISAISAIAFIVLSVILHRKKDASNQYPQAPLHTDSPAEEFARRYIDQPSHIRFLSVLPKLRAVVYENAQVGWDTGITSDMRQASYDVIDFLEYTWLRLAEFYPSKHFANTDARTFIRNFIRDRFNYHWAKYETDGPGTGGTIVGVLAGGDVIADLEGMISDTASALFSKSE